MIIASFRPFLCVSTCSSMTESPFFLSYPCCFSHALHLDNCSTNWSLSLPPVHCGTGDEEVKDVRNICLIPFQFPANSSFIDSYPVILKFSLCYNAMVLSENTRTTVFSLLFKTALVSMPLSVHYQYIVCFIVQHNCLIKSLIIKYLIILSKRL